MAPPTAAYAAAVPPPGAREHDITVFGCTGNAGRAVAFHVLRSASASSATPLRVGLAGRSRDKVEQTLAGLLDELKMSRDDLPNVSIIVADASDHKSMLAMTKASRVVASCAGPYGRYGEAAVLACIEGGAHYLDITGEVPWVSRMITDHDAAAKEAGVALLPFSGYDCVPAELGMELAGHALESLGGGDGDDDSRMGRINLAFRGKGGGFPRGTLETALDGFEGVAPERKDGDVRFYPKEYRGTATDALSPLGFVLPKWSDQKNIYTGPNFMAGINIPVLCRSAPTLGFSSDIAISDRSIVSGRASILNGYGLFPTQLYIGALFLGGMALALPPFRWWLRNKLKSYSFGGEPSGKVFMDAEAISKGGTATATAQMIVPGDPGIYATGLFATGVARALLEATTAGSKLPPPMAGFNSPVAALAVSGRGLLVNHLQKLGAEISVQVTSSKGGETKVLDAATLRSKL